MKQTGRVVYVTGAPGVGKTSVIAKLVQNKNDIAVFEYGCQMANHLVGRTQEELRGGTDSLVRKEDIIEVNAKMIEWTSSIRATKTVLIDTHQVTFEEHGYRVAPFQGDELRLLGITDILVLVAPDEIVVSRISANHGGRRIPSLFQARVHAEAQLQVAISYSVLLGVEARIIETGRAIEVVADDIKKALEL